MPPISSLSSASTEFYIRRNDRTARCLDGRLPPPFHTVISIADGWERSPATLACIETLGNLLARFCPRVTIVANEAQAHLVGSTRTLEIMYGADPFGEFVVTGRHPVHDLEIRVGGGTTEEQRQIAISFDGWVARVSGLPTASLPCVSHDVNHAPGAELAACLGGAAAFRFWGERTTAGISPFVINLFDFDSTNISVAREPIRVNPRSLNLLMVGAGSVGSASAYFLPRLGFRGHVDILDHDMVEIENLDRSPVFEAKHDGDPKASVVADFLKLQSLSATAFPLTWNEFVQKNSALIRKHDAWLALANEHGVRRSMQANYPPVTFQATQGEPSLIH